MRLDSEVVFKPHSCQALNVSGKALTIISHHEHMKKSDKQFGQYIFDNHDFDGNAEDFMEITAPLIGFIVHSFNSLDGLLNSTICELINDRSDEMGAIIIYKLPFSAKVDLFYRLVRSIEVAGEEEISSLKTLIENLKKCGTLRNAVVHAEWDHVDENGYTFVKMHFDKNGMRQHYWQFTPDALEEIDQFIHDTYMMFDLFDEQKQKLFSR